MVTLSYSYYLGINYQHSTIGLLSALMNFFVHTIMYSYYTLNDYLTNNYKNTIKKYSFIITFIQSLQMFIALFSYIYLSIYKNYKFDYFGFTMYVIYGVLLYKIICIKNKKN
jgi:hypothetical protein